MSYKNHDFWLAIVPSWPSLLRCLLLFGALTLVQGAVIGQRLDLKRLTNSRLIQLPFELENDFIVINVMVDNLIPLRFIVDTGAENTIILEKTITDMLNVDYRRTFNIRGADVDSVLIAHLATGIDLRLDDVLLARNRSMLVLGDNYFNFERITGTNIQGILGADFLMRFVLEIDFRRQLLILHEPDQYRPSNRHIEASSVFIRHRPYLRLPTAVSKADASPRRLLLDSGAGLSLLLHTFGDSTSADLPVQSIPTFIANGLGGAMEGSVGRTRTLKIGGKELDDVLTYFQPLDTAGLNFLNQREGILGNRILKRFNVVIDYVRHKVYFRPEGRAWKRDFKYDRSGLSILAGGKNLRRFNVASVVPGSPADRVGIKVGDRIVGVNGTSVTFLSLSSILNRFEGKIGKRVKIKYKRGGEYTTVEFKLEELI